jgi:hypothetical protein
MSNKSDLICEFNKHTIYMIDQYLEKNKTMLIFNKIIEIALNNIECEKLIQNLGPYLFTNREYFNIENAHNFILDLEFITIKLANYIKNAPSIFSYIDDNIIDNIINNIIINITNNIQKSITINLELNKDKIIDDVSYLLKIYCDYVICLKDK